MAKDCWDKGEIIGKVMGAVLIPVVITIGGLFFNWQENQRAREAAEAASKRAATAQMMQIAVGVLTGEPTEETKALREWASEVLKNPGEIIAMNDEVTGQLWEAPFSKSWEGITFYAMPPPEGMEELWNNLRLRPNAPGFEFQGSSPDE